MRKILYIQFTDPGCYPPIIHSSYILAKRGWRVLALGVVSFGGKSFSLVQHENIYVKRLSYFESTLIRKIQYFQYFIWVIFWCVKYRPLWIYASNHMATPIALMVKTLLKIKVLYHEHDSLFWQNNHSFWTKLFLKSRDVLANKADLVVLPHEERVGIFCQKIKTNIKPLCVRNYVSLEEVIPEIPEKNNNDLKLVYCGSVNFNRLPKKFLQAMSRLGGRVSLSVIGFETIGSVGCLNEYAQYATSLGIADKWIYLGAKNRIEIPEILKAFDMGLSFMPIKSTDVNELNAAGASNKPFEYLSQGLGVIISDLPSWRSMFVDSGYGVCCDPNSVDDIIKMLNYCLDNKDQVKLMGQKGRERIIEEWNYEKQFQPVIKKLEA